MERILRYDKSTVTGKGSYARYWHGYLLYLKPLLAVVNYSTIRVLNRVFQFALFAVLILMLVRKRKMAWILPVIGLVVSLAPLTISYSLQYSSVYDIMLIAMIVTVWKIDGWSFKQMMILFLLTGILTSYFDLLTFPVVTLGVPAGLYFAIRSQEQERYFTEIRDLMGVSCFWGIGYLGMWAGKWLMATLITGNNVFLNAYQQIRFRSSTNQDGYVFTIEEMLSKNWKTYFASPVVTILWLSCLVLFILLVNRYGTQLLRKCVPLFLVILMPFVWYIVVSNHSFIHYFFTYRNCAISIFAFLCIVFKYVDQYVDRKSLEDLFKRRTSTGAAGTEG